MTKEEAKAVIEKLVNRFSEQRNGYHAADYNETKTRRDFIDPFFKALGWDMDNEQGVAEPYREVIHEDKVKIQGKTKSPDYGFRLQGSKQQLFFVEAKKPSVSLKTNKESAFQIRRYGWNSKVSVSILTNFEEFIIYDCSKKPSITDSSAVARLKTITYDQFLQEFDFIYDTFSREAVVKGRFDKYVQSDTAKKGTQTPDKEFVVSLDKWRRFIAIDIAKSNLKLNEDEINFAVQLIIDRLIFLRFCEDRGVETYGQLKSAVSKGDSYKNLCAVFKTADDKYNSGLFDFKKDQITQQLKVTNKIIKGIIDDLYYPQSEYDFKALPVEVLGNAYEQFLGKVIRINKAHHAIIEEKPAVRKAGGVFYTPQYIVDYIVENTVGKLIKGKTPKEIEKIKIVDPACGSGSFLLGAFQYLLNYHSVYYHNNGYANKKTKDNPLTLHGTLSTSEKKKILINNIYGVDIDSNAVEVSKLSLLLKCMEGETSASIEQQITMFHERVLPDLDNNIKDGNSLIDTDIYDSQIDFGEEKKIKPFSWKNGFPEVFKQGGFDVVIGNPPYVFTRDVDWPDEIKSYYWNKFGISKASDGSRKNQSGKINLYVLFILKSTELINKTGQVSYIIPNGLLRTTTYDTTRKFLLEKTSLSLIADLKDGVFAGVTASTIIIQFTNKIKGEEKIRIIDAYYKKDGFINDNNVSFTKQSSFLKNVSYTFSLYINAGESNLFAKLNSTQFFFKNIVVDIIEGIVAHKKYIAEEKVNEKYKPFLEGKDIKPFQINFQSRYILFDRDKLHRARPDYVWSAEKKIVIQRISGGTSPLVAALDTKKYYSFASTNLLLIKEEFKDKYSYELICALLNSKLLNFYYSKSFSNSSTLTVNISKTFLEMLPLPKEPKKSMNEEVIKLVGGLSQLKEELKKEKLQTKIEQLKQRIEHSEGKINQLVYKLYDLTPEEIKIVEGGDNE